MDFITGKTGYIFMQYFIVIKFSETQNLFLFQNLEGIFGMLTSFFFFFFFSGFVTHFLLPGDLFLMNCPDSEGISQYSW